MTAPDPAAGLDDAAIEALLGDVDALDKDTDAPPTDWKPLTYAEQRALESKLSRANNSAKNIRLKLKDVTKGSPAAIPPKPGSPAAGGGQPQGDPTPVDAAALRAEITAEFAAKQEAAAVQSSAVTALVAAGLKLPAEKRTAAVKRAVKLLELDGISADDSAGLDAAIDDVKKAWPGLFSTGDGDEGSADKGKKPPVRRLGGPSAASSTGAGGQTLSSAELLAQAIFGKQR